MERHKWAADPYLRIALPVRRLGGVCCVLIRWQAGELAQQGQHCSHLECRNRRVARNALAGKDDEWLAVTPEGYFAASAKGAGPELAAVVRGLEAYRLEQFSELRRPDLVREKLAGDPDGKAKAAAVGLDLAKLIERIRVPKQ